MDILGGFDIAPIDFEISRSTLSIAPNILFFAPNRQTVGSTAILPKTERILLTQISWGHAFSRRALSDQPVYAFFPQILGSLHFSLSPPRLSLGSRLPSPISFAPGIGSISNLLIPLLPFPFLAASYPHQHLPVASYPSPVHAPVSPANLCYQYITRGT